MEDKMGSLKNFFYPSRCEAYPRIGHRCIQIGHHILVFGGCNAQMDFNLPLLRINCETIHTDVIPTKNALRLQGFSLFSYKTHIYLWAGSTPTEPTNALLTYTGDEFQTLPQHGAVPAARHFHASAFFSQRYLLVYGGVGVKEMLEDWHILDCASMSWSAVQVTGEVPRSIENHLMWHAGRGFLLTGESFNPKTQEVVYLNSFYELKFTDFHKHLLRIERVNVTAHAQLDRHRGSPSAVLLNLDSPYVLLLGGERILDHASLSPCNDLWLFNLESLEWTAGRTNLMVGFGFEAVHFQERLYLIGGVGSGANSRELVNIIEVMDLNANSIEAKVCQCCREMYGLKEYAEVNRHFSVKYEHEEKAKSFFSSGLVSRMAKFIKNPFSAVGLLVDNSFNLSSTYLAIDFLHFGPAPSPSPPSPRPNALPTLYNYLRLCDNSYGFTHDEILDCLHSFAVKTERLTSDKKYEEELEIRKEYGVNIKLGGLRLGCSCLFLTRTEDGYLFVCYFSCLQEDAPFTLHYYFRTPEGEFSSPATRHLIQQDLHHFLPADYETLPTLAAPNPAPTTAIYLFHLRDGLRKEPLPIGSSNIFYDHTNSQFFRSLRLYLQALYLRPFVGRLIVLEGEPVKYKQLPTFFRREEAEGRAVRVEAEGSVFTQAELYRPTTPNYHFKEVLVYHLNRLVCSLNARNWDLFGYVEIPPAIPLDICKTKLENSVDELRLNNYLKSLAANSKRTYPAPNDPPPSRRRP